jgi:hypothetical protein
MGPIAENTIVSPAAADADKKPADLQKQTAGRGLCLFNRNILSVQQTRQDTVSIILLCA